MILTGFLPAALAIAVFEVLIDPELVSILIDDLGRGLDSLSSFARGLVLMSTFVACYVTVCLACWDTSRSDSPVAPSRPLS